jgi:hypothetical protein
MHLGHRSGAGGTCLCMSSLISNISFINLSTYLDTNKHYTQYVDVCSIPYFTPFRPPYKYVMGLWCLCMHGHTDMLSSYQLYDIGIEIYAFISLGMPLTPIICLVLLLHHSNL